MLAPGLPSPLDLEKSALRLVASAVFESIVKYLDFFYWGSKNSICGAWASLTNLDHADAEKIASTAAG